jgi:hypothetical protein
MMTAGVGGLAAVTQKTPHLGTGLSVLAGLGVGGLVQPAVTMLTIVSPDEVIGTISAATMSIRLIGPTIGYSVYFNVLRNKLNYLFTNISLGVAHAGLPQDEINDFVTSLLA